MKFIHTSDWQLGKPFGAMTAEARAALAEARLNAIDTIAAAARSHGAQIVLVAGDVFDCAEPGQRVITQSMTRLKAAADINWWLLPGNHDPARADGLWPRICADAPANVHCCLEPAPIALDEDTTLLPAPLLYKRTTEDPTAWFDGAATPAGGIRVGLAHGSIRDFGSATPNRIAPDRAQRSGLAYLALGDWHGRIAVNSATHYSGTPEADDFGRERTGVALLVNVPGARAEPSVLELDIGRYVWAQESWTVISEADVTERIASLVPSAARPYLVARLRLDGAVSLADRASIRAMLEDGLAHELRWLDLDLSGLGLRPTEDDLAMIDTQGSLREAAERLKAAAASDSVEGRRAAAALERLYVELKRAQA